MSRDSVFPEVIVAEIEGQYVEGLPPRTALSLLDLLDLGGGDSLPIGGDGGNNSASNA